MSKLVISLIIYSVFAINLNACFSIVNTIQTKDSTGNISENLVGNSSDTVKESVSAKEIYTLTVYIKELNTGKPLEKVNVFISDKSGLSKNLQTDNDGKIDLIFEHPAEISVTYSLNGYQTLVNIESVNTQNMIKEITLKKLFWIEAILSK